MKLEVGKWYVTRSGESAHKVTQHRPANDIYPFRGSGMNCWRENGRVGVAEKAIFNDDLVREIPDPTQPSQAQSKDAEDARRYRFWRKCYGTRFSLVLPGATLKMGEYSPSVEIAGFDYEPKVDAAIDAAIAAEGKANG